MNNEENITEHSRQQNKLCAHLHNVIIGGVSHRKKTVNSVYRITAAGTTATLSFIETQQFPQEQYTHIYIYIYIYIYICVYIYIYIYRLF